MVCKSAIFTTRLNRMEDVMKLIVFIFIALISTDAFAYCSGGMGFYNCRDNAGNSYSVNQIGDTTYMRGSNATTGNSWNQTTNRIGGTSFTNGRDAQGNSWRSSTQTIGGTSFTTGTDSSGNSFRRTCNQFGCY